MTQTQQPPRVRPGVPAGALSPSLRLGRALLLTLLVLPVISWFIGAGVHALTSALEFSGIPYNGAFQIFNPLRRLAAGQTAGVDFQFFHGLGVPFLHYPLFALFGGTVAASELSRTVVTPLLALISTALVAWAVGRNGKERVTFALLCITGMALLRLDSVLLPGNALEGTRSTTPFIVFAVLFSGLRPAGKAAAAGVALAVALALGTEHGLAAIMAFAGISAYTLVFVPVPRAPALKFAGLTLGSAVVAAFLLYLLMGRGLDGAIGALRYNLSEVAADQMWYFGVPPNYFAETWAVLLHQVPINPLFWLAGIGLLVALMTMRSQRSRLDAPTAAMAFLLLYGIFSATPYLSRITKTYHQPVLRALIILALIVAFDWVRRSGGLGATWRQLARWPGLRPAVVMAYVLASLYAMVWIFSFVEAPGSVAKVAKVVAAGKGPQLNPLWASYVKVVKAEIDKHRPAGNDKPSLWATYSGLMAHHYGVFPASDDFIIHSLGAARRPRYVEEFRAAKPQFVETMRKSWFRFEEWVQNEHWDFYREVLSNYSVLTVTDHSVWWIRRGSALAGPPQTCEMVPLDKDGTGVDIPTRFLPKNEAVTLVSARIRYRIENALRPVPVIGALPRYLVLPTGLAGDIPASLPPYNTEWQFPLVLERAPAGLAELEPRLDFATKSLVPGAKLTVTEICLEPMPLTRETEVFFERFRGLTDIY